MVESKPKCQFCGIQEGELIYGFHAMGLPQEEFEQKINKWGRANWWENLEREDLTEEESKELGQIAFYDQLLHTVGRGFACVSCLQKEDELYNKYYPNQMKKPNVVISLSGGMDSSTLLLKALKEYENVVCISFDYGQKHKIELEKAKELVEYLNLNPFRVFHHDHISGGFEYKYNLVKHQIIKLEGLSNLLVSGLVDNDSMELKKGHYAHENALTSVVPNRNAIFASITYAVALSLVKKTGEPCDIALGTHMGDFDNKKQQGIYPDCSEDFRTALEYAFKIGNWDSDKVNYWAPYNNTDKTGVLKDGIECCTFLGLDYKKIYLRTNTSYAPILIEVPENSTAPYWVSDYKSGSSVERIESFIKLGLEDPIQYAEEDGTLVSWDFVKKYVESICEEWELSKGEH